MKILFEYRLWEGCVPEMVKEEYKSRYLGKFSGRVILFFERDKKELLTLRDKLGLNILLAPPRMFTRGYSELVDFFDHTILEIGKKTDKTSVLPLATRLFFLGDFVKSDGNVLKRKESDFFCEYLPDKGFEEMSFYFFITNYVLLKTQGKDISWSEPIKDVYIFHMKPSEYYELLKHADYRVFVKFIESENIFQRAIACNIIQRLSFKVDFEILKKADLIEDKLMDKILGKRDELTKGAEEIINSF